MLDVREARLSALEYQQALNSEHIAANTTMIAADAKQLTDLLGREAVMVGRMATLATQVEGQTHMMEEVLTSMHTYSEYVEKQFTKVHGRLDEVNGRLDDVNAHLKTVDGRLDNLDGRVTDLQNEVRTGFAEHKQRFVAIEGQLKTMTTAIEKLTQAVTKLSA